MKSRRIADVVVRLGLLDAVEKCGFLIVSFLGSKPSSSDEERLEPFLVID
jgi:hypothetical protein